MGGIFICYRRADSGPYAGRLRDTLTHHFGADQIFRDLDGIHPGERFSQVIDQALTACDVLLAVMGPAWLSMAGDDGGRRLDDPKDYVRREIAAALGRDDVIVIPVLIGATPMPRPVDLPDVLAGLTERNALRLSDENWDDQMAHLVRTVEPVVQRTDPPPAPVRVPPQPSPSPSPSLAPGPAATRRPTAVLAVAAVTAVVLVAALGFGAFKANGGSSSKGGGSGADGNATTAEWTLPTFPPDFGPGDTTVTLSRSSGPPGTTLTVSGTGFGKNETVVIRLVGIELGRTQTQADGSFTTQVTTLSTPFRNTHQDMMVEGNRTSRYDSAPFEVL